MNRILITLACVTLLVSRADATLGTRVQVVKATTAGTTASTMSFTTSGLGLGNYVVIGVGSANDTSLKVSAPGTTDIIGGPIPSNSLSAAFVWIYVYKVIVAGATTVTVSGQTSTRMCGILVEYTAQNLTADMSAIAGATGQTLSTGTTPTTTAANELWVGVMVYRGTFTTEQTSWVNTGPTNSFTIPTLTAGGSAQTSTSSNNALDRAVVYCDQFVTSTGTASTGVTTLLTNTGYVGAVLTLREIPQTVSRMGGD